MSYVRRRPYRKVTAVNCGKPKTALAVAIPKQILHPLRGIPAQIRDDVAVRIHRQANLRVPEDIHYDAR